MDIIPYKHKSVELLFQILELVEVWTRRSMELSPEILAVSFYVACTVHNRPYQYQYQWWAVIIENLSVKAMR